MDKKPFRVTNEQVIAEIACTQYDDCSKCPFIGIESCEELRGNDFDMYKDLLDSRELNDKQEAIIMEMREFIEYIGDGCMSPDMYVDRIAILEKTNDYA